MQLSLKELEHIKAALYIHKKTFSKFEITHLYRKIQTFYNNELEKVKVNVSIEDKAKEKIISANKLYNNMKGAFDERKGQTLE